jgi:hypothetical protein
MSDGGSPAKNPSRAPVRFTAPVDERTAAARAASSPPLDFDDATSPGMRFGPLVSIPSDEPMPAPSSSSSSPSSTSSSAPEGLPASGEITGEMLRRAREQKGFSLDELSEHTKIRKQHLVAIETQDLASLPARVYLRGFLTQIARVLRVDKHRLADGYLAHVDLTLSKPLTK